MSKLLIATHNPGKIRELQDLLSGLGVDLITPQALGLDLELEEDGSTYLENATKKAIGYAKYSNLLTLADDSGLEVNTLNGAPGIYSARYSPKPRANDKDRRDYLIDQLQGHKKPWLANFHCTVVLATPAGETQFAEGLCQGEIISTERGQGGFGYDPIFLVAGLGKTMAELSLAEKNQVSHRSRAVKTLLPVLSVYLDPS
ncbi:MAG: RdgB/HAM1 family non-canonical purine NTP pyrophosphatase [Anaerolineales bacterium]|jgi:XTP/dITP diphosphohydrolase